MRNCRVLLPQIGIALTFLLAPFWLKWSFAPAPFTGTYVLGFVLVAIMLGTIITWVLLGCVGWRRLLASPWHAGWWLSLGLLCGWTVLSQAWAYGSTDYPGLAQTTSLQMIMVAFFAVVVQVVTPPLRVLCGILLFSALLHGTIGGLQVWQQSHLGLFWLGEFALDPSQSGVSVLEANGQRWLRPYGLLPHPNILGGVIALGILGSVPFALSDDKYRLMGIVGGTVAFWFLLLTFSRGAWIGIAMGALVGMVLIQERIAALRKLVPLIVGMLLVGSVFVLLYHPFLVSRVGISQPNTELRSIADRVVYMEVAQVAIGRYPLQGVGAGNFPWFAAVYIVENTDYDLNGNNVHNIYLGIAADLGFVGLALFGSMVLCSLGAMWKIRHRDSSTRAALTAGIAAWAVMGLFDHYMWTLVLTQTIWMSLFVAIMHAPIAQPTSDYEAGVAVGNGTGTRSDSGTEIQSPPVTTT